MKKCNLIKAFKYSVLCFFSFFVFAACEIGLGEAVDLEAPVVKLTSHKDNDSVAQTFRLSGTASDNEDLTQITIDFEEAGIHYRVSPGGSWHKKVSGSGWQTMPAGKASCHSSGDKWVWYVDVNTAEAKAGMGSNYSLEILVQDKMGNSGKNSKINCSLIVDEKIPVVSIYKPDILSDYTKAQAAFTAYDSINGNTFLNLLNENITFYGRQEGSASFRELSIELDDGTTDESVISDNVPVIDDPTTEKIAQAYPLDPSGTAHKYYSKTLVRNGVDVIDLRNWDLTIIPQEWITDAHPELKSGKHLIRVISTSISGSNAWERKVLGYFVWWPEADKPWVTANDGAASDTAPSEVFPSANISGIAYDDDGIASLTYTFKKKADDGSYGVFNELEDKTIPLSEENAKTSAWALKAPEDEGIYELTIKIKDIYGKTEELVRYFKTMDVMAPSVDVKVNSSDGENSNLSVFANANGDIKFTGTTSDDGKIKSLKVIFVNPDDDSPENMILYVGGKESFWNSSNGATDNNGNKLFTITLGKPTYDNISKLNTYSFTKTLNLFKAAELGIGYGSGKNPLKPLTFIFRAIDNGGTATVNQVTLTGDSQAPDISITSIQQFSSDNKKKTEVQDWENDNVPNLAKVETDDYVILKGSWSDNSVTAWNDPAKIGRVSFIWGSAVFTRQKLQKQSNGSYNWEYKVTGIPVKATPIIASITDYAANTTELTKSVFIETTELELERVGANTDDGVYNIGKPIELFLEFTKNTKVTGNPKLKLNLGSESAPRYATFDSSSNNKAQLKFNYIVQDGDNVGNLDVTGITGGTWSDATVDGSQSFTPTLPTDVSKKLGTSRNIRIDTTDPTVSKIESLTPANDYKKDSQILLKLSFSEKVTITNAENMGLGLTGITSPQVSAVLSGSDVIFTYKVGASDNASPLTFTANSLTHSDVTVTDEAGNTLTNWNLAATKFTNVNIDNTPPNPPTISPDWTEVNTTNGAILTADDAKISFTLSGDGVTKEYSLDGGTSWQTYSAKVERSANGVYNITARQTDKAGNVSASAAVKKVTIDKGALFTSVTTTNPSGTYKTGSVITGKINFRKDVALPSGSTVTLNVKRNGAALDPIAIENCTTPASSFTFTYTVNEKDEVDTSNNTNGYLKVKGWSFSNVTVDYGNGVTKTLPVRYDSSKDEIAAKELTLKTGYPKYSGASLSPDNKTLTITFDRPVSKVSSTKEIVLEMTDSFKAPAVLTESQYNDFASAISGLEDYYTAGVNGATTNGTYLKPDTSTKYILNYDTEDTNATLVSKFTTANKHKVIVPLYSSNVKASGTTLLVNLTGAYAIPVKGATYKLTVPAGVVQDDVQNQNNVTSTKTGILAGGVEPPFIRIQKKDQTITSTGSAQSATVTMPDTAKMKINCQTPSATITFAKKEQTSAQITIADCKTHSATSGNPKLVTGDVTYPTTGFTGYSTEQTLGTAIANYDGAKGLKIAIAARAAKNNTTVTSYEYAARTVLKFNLDTGANEYDTGGGYASADTCEGTKHLYNLPVWVQGGDAPAGGNVIAGFPISWDDCSTYKLMKCNGTDFSSDGSWQNEHTYWYWVTWDLSSVCYTGFAVGDVPEDASTAKGKKGPKNWYVGECSWAAIKQNTALYPGETLELSLNDVSNTDDNNNTRGTYLFRTKNKGHRN